MLAAPIYEQLLAFEGQNTVVGSAVACYGAADRMLGALATVMERWDVAERHLENALVLNRRLGRRPGSRTPSTSAHGWRSAAGRRRTRRRHASACPRRWMRRGASGCARSSRASNG